MPYFNDQHLSRALAYLPEHTHQSLLSFLAMLRKKVPVSNTPSQAFGSSQERELFDDYFRPLGGPNDRPWYLPFGKLASGDPPWKETKYAGSSLQRMRTGKQFLYRQGSGTSNDLWSLDPNMLSTLATRSKDVVGDIPVSIHNLAAWCYRLLDHPSHQAAIDRFANEFNLQSYGLIGPVFDASLDPALASIPLSPSPLTEPAIFQLLIPPPSASLPTSSITSTTAVASVGEPTWEVDVAEIKSAISGLEGIEEAANRAIAALRAGMHVIFTGPPGTGKTQLAQRLCDASDIPWTMTAATDQWTTIDTIGGYLPSASAPNSLDFQPGFVTTAIQRKQTLIIDEINRADIDKAFGELFTLLSGNHVDLPYISRDATGAARRIRLAPENAPDDPQFETIRIPTWWRLIGSMNDADKASLKRLSYAFIRRFAFVPIPIPGKAIYEKLIDAGAGEGATGLKVQNAQFLDALKAIFASPSGLASIGMAMGYAIPEAMMRHARGELALNPGLTTEELLVSAFDLFLAPQFQGRAEKHEDLMNLVGQHLKDKATLAAFGERLSVWTGFVP